MKRDNVIHIPWIWKGRCQQMNLPGWICFGYKPIGARKRLEDCADCQCLYPLMKEDKEND